MSNLVNTDNVSTYKLMYETMKHDHEYPNTNLVRLEKWFLKTPGKVFDHGCGYGENLIFLTKRGYQVHGIDISKELLDWVDMKCRIKQVPKTLYSLEVLDNSVKDFGQENSYDHVISLGVLQYLGGKEAAINCVEELVRVLKPGGKLITSIFAKENSLVSPGEKVGDEQWRFKGAEMDKDTNLDFTMYVPDSAESYATIFPENCMVDEVGFWDNEYCGVKGKHHCALATKNR